MTITWRPSKRSARAAPGPLLWEPTIGWQGTKRVGSASPARSVADHRRLDATDIEQDGIGVTRRRFHDVLGDAAGWRGDADRIGYLGRRDPIDDPPRLGLGEGLWMNIPADDLLEQAASPGSEGERATDQARPDQEQGAHSTSRKA